MRGNNHIFWGMFLILWLFWIFLTGSLGWQQLITGAVVGLLVTFFNRDQLLTGRERPPVTLRNTGRFCLFMAGFIIAVLKANIEVAVLVINPAMPINPAVTGFKVDLKKEVSRVILANAITLTPGTLTIICSDREMIVHALTQKHADQVQEWKLIDDIKRMEE